MPEVPLPPIPGLPGLPPVQDTSSVGQTQYLIDTRYSLKTGWVQQPIGGPDGTACEFVKAHAKVMKKTVAWTVERLNAIPACPHWDTGSSNEVLLDKEISPTACIPLAGSGRIFRVSGVYFYGLRVPLEDDTTGQLVCGVIPGSPNPADVLYLPWTVFQQNIIGPAVGPAGKQG